jgi:hypothetical protein
MTKVGKASFSCIKTKEERSFYIFIPRPLKAIKQKISEELNQAIP